MNPAERYFTLLETWLVRGHPEIVGERNAPFRSIARGFYDCVDLILAARGDGLADGSDERAEWHYRYSPGLYGVALLEMFGFLSVACGRTKEGEGWQIEHVSSTPLGMAVFALLIKEVFSKFEKVVELEDNAPESLDVFQPVFQPYVPAWRNNFSLPAWQFREGVHVFKVSFGRGLWRRIAIPGALTLDDLAAAIVGAFDFDCDHLYQFWYRDQFGAETHVHHPFLDSGPWTSEVRVGDVPLQEGQSMGYLYDFGDMWTFNVALERVEPTSPAIKRPTIIEAHGKSPEQYPRWGE